jgi:uncharacterized membrane protein
MNADNILELGMENKLTPTSIRLDLKCGKSGIAKGKKCKKGTAGGGKRIERVLNVAGGALFAGGLVGAGVGSFGQNSAYAGSMSAMYAGGALLNESMRRKGKRTGNKKLENEGKRGRNTTIAASAAFGAASLYVKRGEMKSEYEAAKRAGFKDTKSYKKAYEEARKAQEAKANYNPFKDLGVRERASDEEIQQAYRKAARANHPDLGGDPEKMKNINNAYNEIKRRRGRKDSADDGWDLIEYDYS